MRLLCLASAIAVAASATGQAQSLSDLAKQEKERQAKTRAAGGPARVYTGEVKSDPAADGPTPAADGKTPSTTPSGGPGGADAKGSPSPQQAARVSDGSRATRPREDAGMQRSLRSVDVVMYVTSWCPYCRKALAFLATQPNVRVTTYDIEASPSRRAEMLRKNGGRNATPVTDIGGRIVLGFNPSSLAGAIADARNR